MRGERDTDPPAVLGDRDTVLASADALGRLMRKRLPVLIDNQRSVTHKRVDRGNLARAQPRTRAIADQQPGDKLRAGRAAGKPHDAATGK